MDKEPPKPKDRQFFLNRKIKDPESIRAKIIVEYNSKAVSHVHMQISAPWFQQKACFFPKSQGATSVLPKSRCRVLQLNLGITPPST